MDGRRTDGRTENNAALAQPYHEGKRCSKFRRIQPSSLGGDSVKHGRTVGRSVRWTGGRMEKLTISYRVFKKALG